MYTGRKKELSRHLPYGRRVVNSGFPQGDVRVGLFRVKLGCHQESALQIWIEFPQAELENPQTPERIVLGFEGPKSQSSLLFRKEQGGSSHLGQGSFPDEAGNPFVQFI